MKVCFILWHNLIGFCCGECIEVRSNSQWVFVWVGVPDDPLQEIDENVLYFVAQFNWILLGRDSVHSQKNKALKYPRYILKIHQSIRDYHPSFRHGRLFIFHYRRYTELSLFSYMFLLAVRRGRRTLRLVGHLCLITGDNAD